MSFPSMASSNTMDSVNTNKIIFEVDWSKRVGAFIHKTGYL